MEPERTITVAAAFNGPRGSGNVGYACGLLAQELGGGAEVGLRSPVPLEVPLRVEAGAGEDRTRPAAAQGGGPALALDRGGLRDDQPADPEDDAGNDEQQQTTAASAKNCSG